jgi:hypothetical protein
MSQSVAAAAAIASADTLRVAEDVPLIATEARAPSPTSPDSVELGSTLQPLVVASAWWLLIAIAVIEGLAK